jgi:C4-dicarboxylate-specific signal transduction histidine kinase
MPCAVNATTVPATASSNRHHPDAALDIIAEEPEWASSAPAAILTQLSASIGEINQPISAVVMNAEAALWLLLAEPTNTEAVRRLLACIIKDGMRTGDIVSRTRALIKNEPPGRDASPTDVDPD